MNTKTCGMCKHKGEAITKYDCGEITDIDTGYFMCDLIEHDDGWQYKQGQKAVVTDGSGYMATLCVENDFGCVRWESNEN